MFDLALPSDAPIFCGSIEADAFDEENTKVPISKPTANAQRPNVQETRRTRLRRSWSHGVSWVPSLQPPPGAAARLREE